MRKKVMPAFEMLEVQLPCDIDRPAGCMHALRPCVSCD